LGALTGKQQRSFAHAAANEAGRGTAGKLNPSGDRQGLSSAHWLSTVPGDPAGRKRCRNVLNLTGEILFLDGQFFD
jgi:hypothetical protein